MMICQHGHLSHTVARVRSANEVAREREGEREGEQERRERLRGPETEIEMERERECVCVYVCVYVRSVSYCKDGGRKDRDNLS